jgi:TP901 family phage tail tape measure protein
MALGKTNSLAFEFIARDKASQTFDKLEGKTRGFGSKLAGLAKKAALAGVAVGTAFAAQGVRGFLEFDDKMTQSIAIMDNVSGPMRKKMEDAAREVAKTTRFSAAEAAEAYYFLASAGMDAEQSIAAMPQVAKFAQAGMFDLATATDLATDAQSALGLSVDDPAQNLENLTRVTDVLVKANTLANASVEEFSESLTQKAGAALRNVNKDIEEGVAVLAVFADQGIKGNRAGTLLQNTLDGLANNAIRNSGAFDQLGISVFDSDGNMRNLAHIVADMEDAFSGMSDEQLQATLTGLGFNKQSLDGIKALLGNSEALEEYERELRNAGGTAEMVAERQLESFAAKLDLLKSRIADVGLTVGEFLVNALFSLGESLAPIADRVAGFITDTLAPKIRGAWRSVRDTLFGERLHGPDIHMGVPSIAPFERFKERALGVWDDIKTAFTGPTIGGPDLHMPQPDANIWDRFADIWDRLKRTWDGVKPSLISIGQTLGSLFRTVADVSAQLGISTWQLFVLALEGASKLIEAVLIPAFGVLANILSGVTSWLQNNTWAVKGLVIAWAAFRVTTIVFGIIGMTTAFIANTAATVANTIAKSKSLGVTVALGALYVKDAVIKAASTTATIAQTVATKAATAAQWLLNAAMRANPIGLIITAVTGLVAGFVWLWDNVEGFRNFWIGVWDVIQSAISAVWNWIKDNWPYLLGIITGPIGMAVVLIVKHWDTIVDAAKTVLTAIRDFFVGAKDWLVDTGKAIIDGFTSGVTTAWSAVVDFFTKLPGRIADFFVGVGTWLLDTGKSIIDGLASGISAAWDAVTTFFGNIPGWIAGFFVEAGKWLLDTGTTIILGLLTGYINAWKTVGEWLAGIGSLILGFFADAASWLVDRGESIIRGLGRGIRNIWDSVAEWFTALPGRIGDFFTGAASWLFNAGRSVIRGLRRGIRRAYEAVRDWFIELPDRVKNFFTGAVDWLFSRGKNILTGLWNGIKDIWSSVASWFGEIPGKVKEFFTDAVDWLFSHGKDVIDGLWGGVKDVWVSVWKWFQGMPDRIKSILRDAGDWLWETGKDIMTGLKNGIISEFNSGLQPVPDEIATGFTKWFNNVFKIGSPSKVMMVIGGFVMAGFTSGVKSGASSLIGGLGKIIKEPFVNHFGKASGWLKKPGGNIVSGLRSGISGAARGLPKWTTTNVVERITRRFTKARDWLSSPGRAVINGLRSGMSDRAKELPRWTRDNVVQRITKRFDRSRDWLTGRGRAIINGLRSGINDRAKELPRWTRGNVVERITKRFEKAGDWLPRRGRALINGLRSGISERSRDLRTFLRERVRSRISKTFENTGSWLPGRGRALISGLRSGMLERVGRGTEFFRTIGNRIVRGVKSFFCIRSPSRMFAGFGRQLIAGFVKGMLTSKRALPRVINKVFGSMPKALCRLSPCASSHRCCMS